MNNNETIFWLIGTIIVIILIAASIYSLGMLSGVYLANEYNQQTVYQPNITKNYEVLSQNIQGSHLNLDYNFNPETKTYCIYGVDYIAKPYGSSMQPTSFAGNTIPMKRLNGCKLDYNNRIINCYTASRELMEIGEGDIITFERPSEDKIVRHRISALYPDYAYVESDHYKYGEEVAYENIIGISLANVYT